MEKITDVACVKNEIYKDSIYNLSKILVLKMSETFDEQQYEIYIHDRVNASNFLSFNR